MTIERDAAAWLRAAAERVERRQLPIADLPEALREMAERVAAEVDGVDNGPGVGGVAREGWER